MSNKNQEADAMMFLFVIAAGVVAFTIWKFSSEMNVDFETGFKMMFMLVALNILWLFAIKKGFLQLSSTWSFVLALNGAIFIPAIESNGCSKVDFGDSGFFVEGTRFGCAWYTEWYWQVIILTGVALSPYIYKWLRDVFKG